MNLWFPLLHLSFDAIDIDYILEPHMGLERIMV